MPFTLFIDGAAGTTGLEIAERLAGRGEFALIQLDDAERKDEARRRAALNSADFVILCLPDDAARDAAAMVVNPAVRIIDASSAHRVAPGWTYGFPELSVAQREAIISAPRVTNPGCYSTGFIALVAPLVAAGLVDRAAALTCNAVSGYSGGGKALIARFRDETDLGFRTYALALDHKHVPEMQHRCGLSAPPLFAPSVVPVFRGMIVEVPLAAGVADADTLRTCLAAHYAGSALVRPGMTDEGELTLRDGAVGWDGLEFFVFGGANGQIRLIARLDNLGKGASGACVQNLNLMAGLPETTGLRIAAHG
jgi:N-acetyl-gamma-glutamyl-phosphate reductase